MRWSFRTNGNFIDFVHTDETSLAVESTIVSLHNTSRAVSWSLPEDTTRISFTIDEVKYSNIPITDIDFDGTAMDSQDDFETGIEAMFPGLAGGGSGGGLESVTYAALQTLIAAEELVPGTLYKITDKGDRGLFFQAISTTQLAKDGTRLMLCPARYSTSETVGGNIWKGVWNAAKNPDAGDLMIWGGLVWESLTGNIGTATNDLALDAVNWVVIPKASFTNNEYIEIEFGVNYDIENDWIEKQWDAAGNVLGLDYISFQYWTGGVVGNFCDTSDWNFSANNDDYVFFGNVTMFVRNNSCQSIYLNKNTQGIYNNSNTGEITDNTNPGCIKNNSNSGGIGKNNNNGDILDNSNGGFIDSNSNIGHIGSNSNSTFIAYNQNFGQIYNNGNAGHIFNNSNTGDISGIGAANANIFNNTNNGNITTTTTGDINDTVVNK